MKANEMYNFIVRCIAFAFSSAMACEIALGDTFDSSPKFIAIPATLTAFCLLQIVHDQIKPER